MKARLIQLCREQELDYCLLVKGLDGMTAPFSGYKVYVEDGREEPVHGVEFTGMTLRALRDITAVSKELYVSYPPWDPQASIAAPSILVQEMEIKKSEIKPEKRPHLEHPFFAR